VTTLTYGRAIILGLVQGLTEFLPVSSSAHLVLGRALLGLELPGLSFEIMLHVGTALAVALVYRADLGRMLHAVLRWRSGDPDFARAWLLALASLPAALVGLLLGETIEATFTAPRAAAALLLVTTAWLAWGPPRTGRSRGRNRQAGRDAEPARALPGPAGALAVGVAQAVAVLPGISRSGATVVAGMRVGLPRREAARFALLLSLPVIFGSALADAWSLMALPAGEAAATAAALPPGPAAAGVAAAFVSGLAAIRLLLLALAQAKLGWFGLYTGAVGVLALILL
jgi:undecaprenyl-diphosphatase